MIYSSSLFLTFPKKNLLFLKGISWTIAFCKQRNFERVISRKWEQNRMKRAPASSARRVTRFPRLVNPPRIGSRENTRTNAVFGGLSPFALSPPEVAEPSVAGWHSDRVSLRFQKIYRVHLLYAVVALARKPNREISSGKPASLSFNLLKFIFSMYHLISCSAGN